MRHRRVPPLPTSYAAQYVVVLCTGDSYSSFWKTYANLQLFISTVIDLFFKVFHLFYGKTWFSRHMFWCFHCGYKTKINGVDLRKISRFVHLVVQNLSKEWNSSPLILQSVLNCVDCWRHTAHICIPISGCLLNILWCYTLVLNICSW